MKVLDVVQVRLKTFSACVNTAHVAGEMIFRELGLSTVKVLAHHWLENSESIAVPG
jgi:hypothetical protein